MHQQCADTLILFYKHQQKDFIRCHDTFKANFRFFLRFQIKIKYTFEKGGGGGGGVQQSEVSHSIMAVSE